MKTITTTPIVLTLLLLLDLGIGMMLGAWLVSAFVTP
jgi:hypothetical protein